jgi:hypothetical protein
MGAKGDILPAGSAGIGSHRVDPRLRSEIALASVLGLLLAFGFGAGAPPSEFAPRNGGWWALEPLMIPSFGAGVLLAVAALVVNALPSGHRAGAYLCLVAPLSTAFGTAVADGISAVPPSVGMRVVCLAFLAVPALAALHVLICGRGRAIRNEAGQQADEPVGPAAGTP